MKNQNKTRGYYLKEFEHFDGEYDVTFNILDCKFKSFKKKRVLNII